MMKTSAILAITCTAALHAQNLTPPVAGIVLNSAGRLITVPGASGSLLPGQVISTPIQAPVLSFSFSGSTGAVKTDSELLVLDASGKIQSRRPAPAGPALFSFAPDGTLAWIYFSVNSTLQNTAGSVTLDASRFGDSVVALGVAVSPAASQTIPILATSGNQLWAQQVNAANGVILSQIPLSGAAPAVWIAGGWLIKGDTGLLWYQVGTSTAHAISFPEAVQTLQVSGAQSVSINSAWLLNAQWHLAEIPMPRKPSIYRQDLQ